MLPVKYLTNTFQEEMAQLCTPGVDNSIWVLSTEYNELSKFNIQTRQLSKDLSIH